jgi:hypothetical protein
MDGLGELLTKLLFDYPALAPVYAFGLWQFIIRPIFFSTPPKPPTTEASKPASEAPAPAAFVSDDQKAFIDSLVVELERLSLVRISERAGGKLQGTPIDIDVSFRIAGFTSENVFSLNAEMLLTGGGRNTTKYYMEFSHDSFSIGAMSDLEPIEAQRIAYEKPMKKMIDDIREFVAR